MLILSGGGWPRQARRSRLHGLDFDPAAPEAEAEDGDDEGDEPHRLLGDRERAQDPLPGPSDQRYNALVDR